jgi:hypothetical protein
MPWRKSDDPQASRDVRRAQELVAHVCRLDRARSARELRRRAATSGVSLHAAALAVLATSPTDELLLTR